MKPEKRERERERQLIADFCSENAYLQAYEIADALRRENSAYDDWRAKRIKQNHVAGSGSKPKASEEDIQAMRKLRAEGWSIVDIAQRMGIQWPKTVQRYVSGVTSPIETRGRKPK